MVEVELKHLKNAVSRISDAFSPESSIMLSTDNLIAVSHDFLRYQLEHPADLKNFKKILSKLTKKQQPIYLIEIGILSNKKVLPKVKEAVKVKNSSDYSIIDSISEIARSLAEIVSPETFVKDSERGEEIGRKLAKILGMKIAGETEEQSEARLLQVDSLELQNVKDQIEAKIRKALEEARKKARAAAKVTRE